MNNSIIELKDTTNSISEIDAFLSEDQIFLKDFVSNRKRLSKFLLDSVSYHMDNNPYYSSYCKKFDFSPSQCKEDFGKIPLLPSAIFKNSLEYVKSSWDESILITTSSGTRGSVSQVPRDNSTLMRFFASVAAGVQEVLDIKQSNLELYCLSPSPEEAKHLWIAYVITGVSVYFPSKFYVSNNIFDLKKVILDLRDIEKSNQNKKIVIIGSPALILDITEELEKTESLHLKDKCLIVTMGGWKSREKEMVLREYFNPRIKNAFGLTNEEYIRDVYNMVELNTVIFECSKHQKHCPPWLYVRARDPKTLKILPSGELGILSFLDPTAISYPGFILSDDFGRVREQVYCSCGITGDVVEIERRINKLESRGCALKI